MKEYIPTSGFCARTRFSGLSKHEIWGAACPPPPIAASLLFIHPPQKWVKPINPRLPVCWTFRILNASLQARTWADRATAALAYFYSLRKILSSPPPPPPPPVAALLILSGDFTTVNVKPAPFPPLPSAFLSLFLSHPVCRRSNLLTGERKIFFTKIENHWKRVASINFLSVFLFPEPGSYLKTGTKALRVFLLAIHSHLYLKRILPSPHLSKSGLTCNTRIYIKLYYVSMCTNNYNHFFIINRVKIVFCHFSLNCWPLRRN